MTLYDLIFPPLCPYCDELTDGVRESCEKCARLLDRKPKTSFLENGIKCISVYPYNEETRSAVINFKYHNRKQYGKSLALTLARVISSELSDVDFDIYTSAPSNHSFFSDRFPQTEVLGKLVSKHTGVPFERLLCKTRDSGFQHSMSTDDRRINVMGLYAVLPNADVAGKSILLFDDVKTTGSTLCACSDELIKAGASNVVCVTLTG